MLHPTPPRPCAPQLVPEARNRSVDLVAKEPGDAPPTTDFGALLRDMPRNCDYSDKSLMTVAA